MCYDFINEINKYVDNNDSSSLSFYLSTTRKKMFKDRHLAVMSCLVELPNNKISTLLSAISTMKLDSFYFPTHVIEQLVARQDIEVQLSVINLFSKLQLKFHAEILTKMKPLNEHIHNQLISVYEDLI